MRPVPYSKNIGVSKLAIEDYEAATVGNILSQGFIGNNSLRGGWPIFYNRNNNWKGDVWIEGLQVNPSVGMSNAVIEGWLLPFRQDSSNNFALNSRGRRPSSILHLESYRNFFPTQREIRRGSHFDPSSLLKMETLLSQNQATLSDISSALSGISLPTRESGNNDNSNKTEPLHKVSLAVLGCVLLALGIVLICKTWTPSYFERTPNLHIIEVRILLAAGLIWFGQGIIFSLL